MLSIITVVKNDFDGIVDTYSSISSCSLDLEWIIIDGGDDIASFEFFSTLNFRSFKYIREPDRNLYDAMNKGVKLSKGEHLLFLNAGDKLVNDELNFEVIRTLPSDHGLIASIQRFELNGHQDSYVVKPKRFPQFHVKYGLSPASHQGVIYPRTFFLNYDYDIHVGLHADQISILKLLSKGPILHRSDLVLSKFKNGGIGDKQGRGAFFTQMLRYRMKDTNLFARLLELVIIPVLIFLKFNMVIHTFLKRLF